MISTFVDNPQHPARKVLTMPHAPVGRVAASPILYHRWSPIMETVIFDSKAILSTYEVGLSSFACLNASSPSSRLYAASMPLRVPGVPIRNPQFGF